MAMACPSAFAGLRGCPRADTRKASVRESPSLESRLARVIEHLGMPFCSERPVAMCSTIVGQLSPRAAACTIGSIVVDQPSYRLSLTILALCQLAVVAILGACSRPEDATWDRVRETGALRVGMNASFPPFEYVASDGALVGLDVELARELTQRLGPALSKAEGVQPQFVANLPYDGLYDALTVGRVDVVVSALVINPGRTGDFAYSTPYFDAGQVLVVRDGEAEIKTPADLSGHTVAAALGSRGDLEARKRARRLADLTVVQRQTAMEALEAVAAGEVDAALVDRVSALQAIGAGSEVIIVGEPVTEEPYAVAVRRDSQRLLQAINEALADMKTDGTMDALVAKWVKGS